MIILCGNMQMKPKKSLFVRIIKQQLNIIIKGLYLYRILLIKYRLINTYIGGELYMFKIGEEIEHDHFGLGCIEKIGIQEERHTMSVYFYYKKRSVKFDILFANESITRFTGFGVYDKDTCEQYNESGFTELGFDRKGYNYFGFNDNGYNPSGYDVKGNHKSEELKQIIIQKTPEYCEFDFDGFYHMTHYENAVSMLKAGKINSRNKNLMKVDMVKEVGITDRVISATNSKVKDYVRFYFRPKNPIFWHFEDNKKVVLLKFKTKLLTHPGANISIGSAGYLNSEIKKVNKENLGNIDFESIFSSSKFSECKKERNLRNTELLILNEVNLIYLESLIFRNVQELQKFKIKYGHFKGVLYDSDKSKFYQE